MRVKYLAQEHNAVPLPGLKPGPFNHALTNRPDRASHYVELNNFFNLSLFDILPQFFTKVEVNSGGYLPSRESV